MAEDDGLPGPKGTAAVLVVERNRQVSFSLASALALAPEELVEGGGATDAALLVVEVNHGAHGLDPARAVLAHDHASADMGAPGWLGTANSSELVVGQRGIVELDGIRVGAGAGIRLPWRRRSGAPRARRRAGIRPGQLST